MKCCRRDGYLRADGRWTMSSKGQRFGGEVPARGVCEGGGWASRAEKTREWG